MVKEVGRCGGFLLMTNIALLAEDATAPCTIDLSEDWRDAIIFVDTVGRPTALDGIAFTAAIQRVANGVGNTIFTLSTANGFLVPLAGFATVAVGTQGIGYATGDKINIAGGIGISPAMLQVTGVGAGGNVTSAVMLATGVYSQLPENPVVQGSSTGAGAGATFTLTWVNNALGFIVPKASLPPLLKAGSYSMRLQAAADGMLRTVANINLTAY
jgi:hypothetical protein